MAARPLSRRSFLALSGGVVLLAACGGDDDSGASDAGSTGPGSSASAGEYTELSPGVVSSDLHVSREPQRLAFAMLAKEGYASGGPARIAIAPPGETPTDFTPATLHANGLPDERGIYVADVVLPTAGNWQGLVEYAGEELPFAFAVRAEAAAPVAGSLAPTDPSPTTTDALGVDPLCTRGPECPLHERSLADLVGKGRPVAVLFGTPQFCQTQYCGPVLDLMLPLVPEYPGIDFVHVEIYNDDTATTLVPTVEDWGLPSEPWFFTIDESGEIVGRLDGAFDTDELRAELDRLTA